MIIHVFIHADDEDVHKWTGDDLRHGAVYALEYGNVRPGGSSTCICTANIHICMYMYIYDTKRSNRINAVCYLQMDFTLNLNI
jgi:hypothetical protein